jgi:hypothetical protein
MFISGFRRRILESSLIQPEIKVYMSDDIEPADRLATSRGAFRRLSFRENPKSRIIPFVQITAHLKYNFLGSIFLSPTQLPNVRVRLVRGRLRP